MTRVTRFAGLMVVLILFCALRWQPVMAEPEARVKAVLNTSQSDRDYSEKNLEGLVEELLEYNPQLQSLVAKINAARAFIPQASAPDDPRLSFEASNIPVGDPSLSRTPMTGMQIYLRQRVPFRESCA